MKVEYLLKSGNWSFKNLIMKSILKISACIFLSQKKSGGNPRESYDNTIGYFDALIIGTKNQQRSTLFDFACNN